jgi:hypothetical protein
MVLNGHAQWSHWVAFGRWSVTNRFSTDTAEQGMGKGWEEGPHYITGHAKENSKDG